MQKYAGSISCLLSSKYQTCLFIGPSAFQSLCLAQIIILLVLDAYPPCLCVCKSYPSWEGCLIKPSLIMHCPVLWPFFPHICGLVRFSDSKVQGQLYTSLSPSVAVSTELVWNLSVGSSLMFISFRLTAEVNRDNLWTDHWRAVCWPWILPMIQPSKCNSFPFSSLSVFAQNLFVLMLLVACCSIS